MPDDENLPVTPSSQPMAAFAHVDVERRKEQDRRQSERQGKYDRRRNRCVHCVHFKEEAAEGKGRCLFHQTDMVAYAFACPNFEALPSEQKK